MSQITSVSVPDTDGHTSVHAVAAAALEDEDVAGRVADAAAAELDARGVDSTASTTTAYAEADSPGVVLTIVAGAGRHTSDATPRAGFVGYGDADTPPASVVDTAVAAVERWAETGAPVDPHLADQLVVWLALVGGAVPIPRVTDHVRTNVDLVRAFGYDVSTTQRSGYLPTISSPRM